MDLFTKAYEYLAGGKTVTLQPDSDFVGLHLSQLEAGVRRKLEDGAQVVSPGLAIVEKKSLPGETLRALHKQGAVFPVFSSEGARVIALPEVRVELPSGKAAASGHASLTKWLREHTGEVEVVSQQPDRFVLAPVSGYGPDAVTLAHDIAGKFKSCSASPRFVRVVSRPK
jgi:hypothetical protein